MAPPLVRSSKNLNGGWFKFSCMVLFFYNGFIFYVSYSVLSNKVSKVNGNIRSVRSILNSEFKEVSIH